MEAILVVLVAFLSVVGVAVCIAKPRYAFVPVLMLFPIEQILMGYIRELRFQYGWLVNVIVGLIACFGVGYAFFRGEKVFRGNKNRIFWGVISLYVYILISIIWSPARESAFFYLEQSWAYFFLLFIVAPMLIRSLDDLVQIVPASIFVGIVLMTLMLVNPNARFIDDRFVIDLGYGIGIGTMRSNPLAIADAGSTLAIMAALYRPRRATATYRLLSWAGIGLGMTLALLSGSRGQVLAGAAIIAVMLPFVSGSKNALRVAGSLIVVGLMLGFLYFVFTNFVASAGQSRWGGHESAEGLGTRLGMAAAALEGYGASPQFWLIGGGSAAFNAFYTFRAESAHWYPHNIVIEAVTEYGLPGIVLLTMILYTAMKLCVKMTHDEKGDLTRRSTVLVMAGLIIFNFMMSLKQGAMLGMPPVFMFCIIIGRVARNEETNAVLAYNQAVESGELDEEHVDEGELAGA